MQDLDSYQLIWSRAIEIMNQLLGGYIYLSGGITCPKTRIIHKLSGEDFRNNYYCKSENWNLQFYCKFKERKN